MLMSMRRLLLFPTLLALGGCATLPMGPSVRVMPGPGKTFEQFRADDVVCRQWASQQIGMRPQETLNQNVATGAITGTAIGAGVGALLGAAAGNPGVGAAIGAGSGLLVGTASGANAGNAYGWEAQRRYDNTYVQCMYAKGNQVPGTVQKIRRVRRIAPPPPPQAELDSVPPDYLPSYPPSLPPPRQ
jgi:hypothetical protein